MTTATTSNACFAGRTIFVGDVHGGFEGSELQRFAQQVSTDAKADRVARSARLDSELKNRHREFLGPDGAGVSGIALAIRELPQDENFRRHLEAAMNHKVKTDQ
jgi:hypothetical protein